MIDVVWSAAVVLSLAVIFLVIVARVIAGYIRIALAGL